MYLLSNILRRIFAGLLFFCLIAQSVQLSAVEQSLKDNPRDSLRILDSLANANKINNPILAQQYARNAIQIAQRLKNPGSLIDAYLMMGISFLQTQKDSSFYFYNKALVLADSSKLVASKPQILYDLASVYSGAQDYKQAIVLLDSCINLSESLNDYGTMTDAYNMLGNIKLDINDTASAFQLYKNAFKIAKEHSFYRQMGNALSNLAKNEMEIKTSISMQKEAIKYLRQSSGTEEEIAGIYINIANRITDPDSAIYYYRKALTLAEKGNLWEVSIGACNNMAYSYLDKKDPDNAEKCILMALPLATRLKSPDWLSELYDSYADILTSKGDFKQAFTMQKKSLDARIEADQKQASNQLRLLAVLLDVKNKELLIQNKEKELLIQQNRLRNAQLWLVISVLVIIGFVFVILWLQQRYRMRLQHEQISSARRIIEMEENEKGKTARELHDITGQLVLGITGEIENIDFPDVKSKEQLQGKIKDLGRSIRLISHRMNRAMMEHFSFEELIEGQCNDVQKLTGIPIHVEIPEVPMTLPEEVILHTYRMVQELLTNASKYVKGHQVWIHIVRESNGFILTYKDDGPGFDTEKVTKSGMGLSNIFERAKLLGGQAIVTSSPEKGTNWEISIPFHKKN
jgi:signal transduction histidine kinase